MTRTLEDAIRDLHNEVDCRVEHGAVTGGHLEYVRGRLAALLEEADAARGDGLTDAEGAVMDGLVAAVEAFARLDPQHPSELPEFVSAIHACQYLLATRVARRYHPAGWPIKPC